MECDATYASHTIPLIRRATKRTNALIGEWRWARVELMCRHAMRCNWEVAVRCTNCGSDNDASNAYCIVCGRKLVDSASVEVTERSVLQPSPMVEMSQPTIEKPYVVDDSRTNLQVGDNSTLLIVIALATALALGAVGMYALTSRRFGVPSGGDVSSTVITKLSISQVDTTLYPQVTLYVDVRDDQGDPIINMDMSSLVVEEYIAPGEGFACGVTNVLPVTKGGSTYQVTYTARRAKETDGYLTVRIACREGSGYQGSAETTYRIASTESTGSPTGNVQQQAPTTVQIVNTTSGNGFILPDSSSRYYSASELSRLSNWELEIARNEIYARHGRGFRDDDLQNYFDSCSWYTKVYSPDEFDAMPSPLNEYEVANVTLINSIEDAR